MEGDYLSEKEKDEVVCITQYPISDSNNSDALF